MSIITAQVTDVSIGLLTIPGLMDQEGKFYVGVPQMVEANLVPPERSIKQLQSLYGKAFASHSKLKTPLNSKAINAIPLENFTKVIIAVANTGNVVAQQLRDDLVGLSLQQLFCDAFNVKFEQEERQEWLTQRQSHLKRFHPIYTSWLKKDGVTTTYGTEVNNLKEACKLPLVCLDTYSSEQLAILNRGEASYNSLRIAGLSHEKALEIVSVSR